jgi:hypothetical protein
MLDGGVALQYFMWTRHMRIAVFLQRNAWVRRQGVVRDSRPVNSMSFIWNDNMREKSEANANATWRALIRDRPRGDGV